MVAQLIFTDSKRRRCMKHWVEFDQISPRWSVCVCVGVSVVLPLWMCGFLMTVYAFLCVGWCLASLIKEHVYFTRNYRCWIAVWRENCRGRKRQELDQWKLKIMSLVGLVLVRCNMSVFSQNWGIFVSLYQGHLVIFFSFVCGHLDQKLMFWAAWIVFLGIYSPYKLFRTWKYVWN